LSGRGSEARNDLTPPVPAFTPFSDEDFETLGDWLVRRAKGISDIVELEGFLTAIVIGPNTLSPLAWLPKVWGGKQPSGFKDLDELNRFVALVMGFYNSIVAVFEATPRKFAPTFYESKEKGKRVLGRGNGLHWEGLDLDLSVPGLLSSLFSGPEWLAELGRIGGRNSSAAKAAAARKNGRQGGRPRTRSSKDSMES
jgi:hypothetical protein